MESHLPVRRVSRSLPEARDLVAAWKASGLNKEAWCRSQGIRRSALMSWLYRVEAQVDPPTPPGFIEIVPPALAVAAAPVPPLILDLGHGMRLVGLDSSGVLALVRALRQEPT